MEFGSLKSQSLGCARATVNETVSKQVARLWAVNWDSQAHPTPNPRPPPLRAWWGSGWGGRDRDRETDFQQMGMQGWLESLYHSWLLQSLLSAPLIVLISWFALGSVPCNSEFANSVLFWWHALGTESPHAASSHWLFPWNKQNKSLPSDRWFLFLFLAFSSSV